MNERFENLVRQYGKALFNYILRMVRRPEDAEDITQAVFLEFLKRMDSVSPEAHVSYLYRSAHNMAINNNKRNRPQREVFPDDLVFDPAHDTQALERKRNRAIYDALGQLNDKESQAVNLQFYENMNYHQISEVMGISHSAVESLLVRAKRKLRDFLSQENWKASVL